MAKASVLVVDDHVEFRSSLRELLEIYDFSVTEATDGLDAADKLAGTGFDLVITDMLMPGKDGLELLQWMAQQGLLTHVIVITGGGRLDAGGGLRLSGKYESVKACLHKPFSSEQLLGAMASALGMVL